MKFSENWLRQFVDPPLASEELAHALTMAGLEVESVAPVAPPFDKVVVAEVLAVDKHPDADRLSVCRVNAGLVEPLQVVCGAPEVRPGMKVPCALAGAQLPGLAIKRAEVRGVESLGMLCSAQELGLAEPATGLLALPADAPVGADLREYLDLDDCVFALKLTPNRADCLSVAGVAREVAAITASSLRLDETRPAAAALPDALAVRVLDAAACPLYCGRVLRGLRLDAATPPWMARCLERSGLRSVNAVVDITNFVMLELGQPLHAFDLAQISGAVSVRRGRAGESLTLLNGQAVALAPEQLVIADDAGPLALAGVMGGAPSGVTAATRDLFLESAFFAPQAIAATARRFNLASDSSHRFERGVDFAATRAALERATQLTLAICGGRAGPVTEVRGELPARPPIALRLARVQRVLGVPLGEGQVQMLLRRLHFSFGIENGVFHVTPHSYRFDLALEEDLIEELARIHGYDNIPGLAPGGAATLLPEPERARGASALREFLRARDYQEVVNYAFVDEQWEADLCGNSAPLRLKNPIASQMAVMRSSLVGGLIARLKFNLGHAQARVRLFESGACFTRQAQGHAEAERIAGLAYGTALPEQWGAAARAVDFFDVKGDLEALCWPEPLRCEAAPHPALHPGKSARVFLGDEAVGWLGELHPRWQRQYELPGAPVVFELDAAALLRRKLPAAREISRFPQVRRDIAVTVDESLAAQTILDALREAAPAIVAEIELFDVYRGQGVESGKKSLAFRVLLQDTQKTLTDSEANSARDQLVGVLEGSFSAKLRA